jgi:hypothetical protein
MYKWEDLRQLIIQNMQFPPETRILLPDPCTAAPLQAQN